MPYLAVVVCQNIEHFEPADWVGQSASWKAHGIGATVRFLSADSQLPSWPYPPYDALVIDGKLADAGVTLWRSKDSNDCVLCLSRVNEEVVDRCIEWTNHADLLDFRIVAAIPSHGMLAALADLVRFAYHHLPTTKSENVDRTVAYCASLLEKSRRRESPPAARPNRPARRLQVETEAGSGSTEAEGPPQLGGLPISFGPDFTRRGFKINPQAAREGVDGIVVSAGPAAGAALYGPYLTIGPGQYTASASIRGLASFNGSIAEILRLRSRGVIAFDAFFAKLDKCAAASEITAGSLRNRALLQLQFTVPVHAEPILLELRVHQRSNKNFLIESIKLEFI